MKLTKKLIEDIQPPATGVTRLSDGAGLYIEVMSTGSRRWRMAYRHGGKQKTLTIGPYPAVSLGAARKAREDARVHIAFGRDPGEMKQLAAGKAQDDSRLFKTVAEAWMDKRRREGMKPATLTKDKWTLKRLNRAIGDRDMRTIRPKELIDLLRVQVDEGLLTTVQDTRFRLQQIWGYAIASEICDIDPTTAIRHALPSPKKRNHSAILEKKKFGSLIRAVETYHGWPQVRDIITLSIHVVLRSREIRLLRWSDYDEKERMITVPAAQMKMEREFLVPVSDQAAALLERVRLSFGSCELIFPTSSKGGHGDEPLSGNTLNKSLRVLGFGKDEVTHHGLRSTFSTMAHESGLFDRNYIEKQLSHETGGVAGAYNKAGYMTQRRQMMQWWSDQIDIMKALQE